MMRVGETIKVVGRWIDWVERCTSYVIIVKS